MLRFFKKFLALRKKRKALMSSPVIIKNETSVLDVDLLDKQTSEQDKKTVRQYTKTLITALTICSCVWISLSYVMSAYALIVYGDSDPLSNLSERVCAVVIGTVITYSVKAWLESFSEKTITPYLLDKDTKDDNDENEIVG